MEIELDQLRKKRKVLEYVQKRRLIEQKAVRLVKYQVTKEQNDIILTEIDFEWEV